MKAAARTPMDVGVALRSVIERDGTEVPRGLYIALDRFNREHFDRTLPAVTILVTNPGSPRTMGDHIGLDVHGIAYRVRIAPAAVRRGPRFLEDILFHELVHVAAAMADEPEPGYQGHGPKFAARCNGIGARLGLPPVGARPRGRAALPDCAQWPINVRPAGYYGDVKEDAKPKPAIAVVAGGDGPPNPKHPKLKPEHRAIVAIVAIVEEAIQKLEGGDDRAALDLLRSVVEQ
jgi:hypothetical protein